MTEVDVASLLYQHFCQAGSCWCRHFSPAMNIWMLVPKYGDIMRI